MVYEGREGTVRLLLERPSGLGSAVTFSLDGKLVASAFNDKAKL
jgi:hypothetical protein